LLREHGVDPEIVEYLKRPPEESELARLLELMGLAPRDILRRREKEYRELGLAAADHTDGELIEIMVAHPRLIERPIVVSEDGRSAVLGRPTERVLEVL
jgi:arsenate reductase